MSNALNKLKDAYLWAVETIEDHPHATLALIAGYILWRVIRLVF